MSELYMYINEFIFLNLEVAREPGSQYVVVYTLGKGVYTIN